MTKKDNILIIVAGLISLLIVMIIAFGLAGDNNIEGHFINSDTLYQPSFYQDLMVNGNSIKTWELNPAPNFFPDSVLYFTLMALTHSITWSSFLFFLIQTLLIIILFMLILRAIQLKDYWFKISIISIPLLLLFPMVSIFNDDFLFYFYFISNSYHTGSFVTSLLLALLIIKYLTYLEVKRKINIPLLVLTCVILILGVLSDRLLIPGFGVPVILSLLFTGGLKYRERIIPMASLIITVLLGTFLGEIIRSTLINNGLLSIEEPQSFMNFDNVYDSFSIYFKQISEYLLEFNFKSLIILISLFNLILLAISVFREYGSTESKTNYFFKVFLLTSSLSLIFAPILGGNYTGPDTIRYNYHVFILLLISSALLFNIPQKAKVHSLKISFGLLVSCIALFIFFWSEYSFINYFNLYPRKAQAADQFARETGLRYGTGDYWDAKLITMFSKEGVVILPTFYNTVPYFHANNKSWYFRKMSDREKNATFHFSLIDFEEREVQLRNLFNNQVDTLSYNGCKFAIHPEYSYNDDLTFSVTQNNSSN